MENRDTVDGVAIIIIVGCRWTESLSLPTGGQSKPQMLLSVTEYLD